MKKTKHIRLFVLFLIVLLSVQNVVFAQKEYSAQGYLKQQILFYDDTLSNTCNTNTTSTTSNNRLYVIGDSYSQGVEGVLKPKLSEIGYEVSGWNGLQGRSINNAPNNGQTGLQALEADSDTIKSSGSMLVILGTNGISSGDITNFMNKARSYNPNIRTYWVNVNYPRDSASDINKKNQPITDGASKSNYTVIDWHNTSTSHMSDYFSPDNVHPNSAGYKALSEIIISALQSSSSTVPGSTSTVSGFNNTDYAGNSILSKAQLDAIQENQPFYQSAADKVGIPWQMIAVIHLREHGLQRDGPSNGDGPYQILNSNSKIGTYTDEEFQAATDKAAEFILNKSGKRDLSSIDNIKYTLFAYNGAAPAYKTQAINLGFSQDQADNGEGSPYVMNRADAKRDPTIEPTKSNKTWGQFKPDFQYPANSDYGAFVQYTAIANISTGGGCSTGSLASGGMTLEQAKEFMDTYKTSPDSESYVFKGAEANASGSILANCTAFSSYFVNKYTTLKGLEASPVGNGWQTVSTIAAHNTEVTTGTEAKVYAVFSISGDPGHTGVVLGIDTTKGIVITGEASWSNDLDWIGPKTHTLEEIKNERWTFAYTDGYLKGL